jgi:hypothetical protein
MMKMKKRVPIAIAAVLTACGAVATNSNEAESAPQKSAKAKQPPSAGFPRYEQGGMAGCFDPKLSGYARAAAEHIGGLPCNTPTSAEQGEGDSWIGKYAGRGDGGATQFTVTAGGGAGRYSVAGELIGEGGCSGELSGTGTASGNHLTLIAPIPGERRQCQMVFTRQGKTIAVQEGDNCSYFHGMSCEFSGSVTRRGSSASVSTPAPAQGATPWIVGAWVSRGESCQGDSGLIFASNGTYSAAGSENGRWSLSGATLAFTALETFEMGEAGTTAVPNPHAVRSQIIAASREAFKMRGANGVVWDMVRCR